jgi:hypothetical protein
MGRNECVPAPDSLIGGVQGGNRKLRRYVDNLRASAEALVISMVVFLALLAMWTIAPRLVSAVAAAG